MKGPALPCGRSNEPAQSRWNRLSSSLRLPTRGRAHREALRFTWLTLAQTSLRTITNNAGNLHPHHGHSASRPRRHRTEDHRVLAALNKSILERTLGSGKGGATELGQGLIDHLLDLHGPASGRRRSLTDRRHGTESTRRRCSGAASTATLSESPAGLLSPPTASFHRRMWPDRPRSLDPGCSEPDTAARGSRRSPRDPCCGSQHPPLLSQDE